MRTLLVCSGAVLCIAAIACSSNPSTNDGGPTGQICPSNIIEATAAPGAEGTTSACHVENYTCVIGYLCGSFVQQATCVCQTTNGQQAFVCTVAANGKVLDTPVEDPSCSSTIPAPDGGVPASCSLCQSVADGGKPPDPCPTDKTTASGTSCTNIGQQCFYPTTCTGQPPPQDVCQCIGNVSGDAGLSWNCELNQCP